MASEGQESGVAYLGASGSRLNHAGGQLQTHSHGCSKSLLLTGCCPKVLSSLTHGLLHEAVRNMAADFPHSETERECQK